MQIVFEECAVVLLRCIVMTRRVKKFVYKGNNKDWIERRDFPVMQCSDATSCFLHCSDVNSIEVEFEDAELEDFSEKVPSLCYIGDDLNG